MNFLDKLYIGFYAYGRNFYQHGFSKFYGEALLTLCICIAISPAVIYFAVYLNNFFNPQNSFYISISIEIIILFFLGFYFEFRDRNQKIIDYYYGEHYMEVNRLKKISGYIAVLSFTVFIIGIIIIIMVT